MNNMLRKVMNIWMSAALLLGVMVVSSQDVQAADVNKQARIAFSLALEQGKIKYDGEYCLYDLDSDGVKELIVTSDVLQYVFWKYSGGKVSKIADCYIETNRLYYDKKTNTVWALGDGDGAWINSYKLKNGKFKETGTWYGMTADGKKAEKNTKKGTKKMKVSEYRKIQKYVEKNNAISLKRMSKWELISNLQGGTYCLNLPTKNGKYYRATFVEGDDKWGSGESGEVSKITFKGDKMIVKGSLREAATREKLYNNKESRYLGKATRTFKLDKKFAFYGGEEMGKIRYTIKEGKKMCERPLQLGLEFKVKNKKLISLTFWS